MSLVKTDIPSLESMLLSWLSCSSHKSWLHGLYILVPSVRKLPPASKVPTYCLSQEEKVEKQSKIYLQNDTKQLKMFSK